MKKRRYIYIGIVLLTLLGSCKKWLNVQPSDQVTDESLFGDVEGVRNALNGVYKKMSDGSLYGRQLTWGFPSLWHQEYNANNLEYNYRVFASLDYTYEPVQAQISATWADAFNAIANCNKLISEVEKIDTMFFPRRSSEKGLIIGEALAARALLHFDMLRLFAASPAVEPQGLYIPYQKVYPVLAAVPLPTSQVLANIVADLERAKDLVAPNDTLTANNRSMLANGYQSQLLGSTSIVRGGIFFNNRMLRLNFVAIHGLLARVYLYAGDKVNAKKNAAYVYDNFGPAGRLKWWTFTPRGNAEGVNKSHKLANDILFACYDINMPQSVRSYRGANTFALSNHVPSWWLPADRDYRSGLNTIYNISEKWEPSVSTVITVPQQNLIAPVLRMSEIYYIYSECLFEEGNTANALTVLNQVRLARGIENNFLSTNRDDFYNELLSQYRREFVVEGQTIFAYKRLNRDFMAGSTGSTVYKMDRRFILPIPNGERIF